uniref:Reverse transcriptase domain-containing protein n=1 Tax=Astyanax mexicanus TaxID=7994 RepID=A0A3B1J8B1_ASTMX
MTYEELKIISFNVNGLLNPIKRSKILSKMKKEKASVVFLQETHLSDLEHEKLKRMGFSKVFFSSYKTGSRRGVAILVSQQVPFELISSTKDKEGRFILISGRVDEMEITLLNVYAPPGSNLKFYQKMFDLMAEATGVLICGGDWNIHLNPKMDASHTSPKKITLLQKRVRLIMEELGIIDLWRDFYPTGRDYTHYSSPHSMYSRIDYFFTYKKERHKMLRCEIGTIDLSDHAPISMSVLLRNTQRNRTWRLNSSVLNNPQFINQMKQEIKMFLEENDNGEVGPEFVWDTLKAVFRGKMISYCSFKKKIRQSKLAELNAKLKELEIKHKATLDPNCMTEILKIRNEINIMYTQEIEKNIIFTKQKYYEAGTRSAKLLAKKIKKQQADSTIYKIRDPQTKTVLCKCEEIQTAFKKYYEKLYSQQCFEDEEKIEIFLKSHDLPTLTDEQNNDLKSRITKEELEAAITRLKANKSPGTDGFPNEWYKVFRAELVPYLLEVFNSALIERKMPPSWKEAIISVIPKEGKDALDCGSYRPISVLNVDYKLYTSIIAKRLENILPLIIDKDQTGFIKNRQTHDNIRRTLHIMDHIKQHNSTAALVSLDAEKAFDSVDWKFLYKVLSRLGFDEEIIQSIQTIYYKPTARIKINGSLSETIVLERGTRQGCPLSTSLFALYIEPLAQWIRQMHTIKGITVMGKEHKLALYADDVLLFLSDPSNSFVELMKVINAYTKFSGYKLNIQKTQVLSFNYIPPLYVKQHYNLKWDNDSIKYLGINLPKDLSQLSEKNFGPLFARIKSDIRRWDVIPFLGLISRVESIKMNILPRFLYLFQALPIGIPANTFKEWDKIISRYIWQGRKPRIRLRTLQLPKKVGGMALPNLEKYYLASQTRPLIYMCDPNYTARWKDIEASTIKDPPIQALLGDQELAKNKIENIKNPYIKTPLITWVKVTKKYNLKESLKVIRWCAYDTDFIPNKLDTRFKIWSLKGITAFCNIMVKYNLQDFQTIKEKYSLENQDFYRYLQIRHYFNKTIKINSFDDSILKLFIEAYQSQPLTGIISKMYEGLMELTGNSTEYIKQKWEKESCQSISNERWPRICEQQWKCTSAHNWREFGWKCVTRFFITPKQRPGENQDCWRLCGGEEAGHWHIFWGCPKLGAFWSDLHSTLQEILNLEINFRFNILFLGEINPQVIGSNRYLWNIFLIASKKAITKRWRTPDPPVMEEWINIVNQIYIMEKITFAIRIQMPKFAKLWSKWTAYMKTTRPDFIETQLE